MPFDKERHAGHDSLPPGRRRFSGLLQPLALWTQTSPFGKGIILLLLGLLALQIYIAVERGVMYFQSNAASRAFLKLFLDALRKGDLAAAGLAAEATRRATSRSC